MGPCQSFKNSEWVENTANFILLFFQVRIIMYEFSRGCLHFVSNLKAWPYVKPGSKRILRASDKLGGPLLPDSNCVRQEILWQSLQKRGTAAAPQIADSLDANRDGHGHHISTRWALRLFCPNICPNIILFLLVRKSEKLLRKNGNTLPWKNFVEIVYGIISYWMSWFHVIFVPSFTKQFRVRFLSDPVEAIYKPDTSVL